MKQTFFDHSRPLTDWTLAAFAVCDGKKPPQATAAALEKGVPAVVPGLVHDTLLARELMADPLIGMHCFEGEWVENQQWIYRTRFDFAETLGEKDRAELVFESLDGRAEVFLNGELLALHRNSYRPLVADIAKRVRAKDNELEVRLTMGLDDPLFPKDSTEPDGVSFATEETLGYRPNRGEPWRIFQRKPAFGYGWDWSPRVATIGIAGTVAVRVSRKARIEGLLCSTISCDEKNARVKVCVELEGLHYYASTDAVLEVRLAAPNGDEVAVSRQDVLVRSGFNEVEFYFDLPSPQLWWPRGYGDQPLYAVYTRLDGKDSDAGALSEAETHMGIRTLALQSAGTFGFEINGKRIFCQGGNWIPPDAIYTRISDRRYETLIALAAQAGMNTLRIWGGGNYERDVFYRTCDRLGVLVWQDFMFACAPYPDHLEWFRDEVAQEARYQVRRLASHACLALWCGSNENTWGFCDWWGGKTQRGARLYNDILPRAVRANAPHVPYWTGSPYGGATPNQPGTGSNHFWKEEGATLCPDLPKRINLRGHDLYPSFFISEYGYHGPCSLRETRRYLGSETVDRSSEVWLHHTNTRRYEETLCAAVKGVYGVDMATVANEAYLLYGGLWQGLAYAYSLDAARFRPECSGAILWMFNEAWGEAGWGVVDNALSRKISWYFVRRALAPRRLILRHSPDGKAARAVLFSEVADGAKYEVEVRSHKPGEAMRPVASFQGTAGEVRQQLCEIALDANGREATTGGFVVLRGRVDGQPLATVVLWPDGYLPLLGDAESNVRATVVKASQPDEFPCVRLESDGFAHGVHLAFADAPVHCSDNYFDLFSGESLTVRVLDRQADLSKIHVGWIGARGRMQGKPLVEADVLLGTAR